MNCILDNRYAHGHALPRITLLPHSSQATQIAPDAKAQEKPNMLFCFSVPVKLCQSALSIPTCAVFPNIIKVKRHFHSSFTSEVLGTATGTGGASSETDVVRSRWEDVAGS